MTESAGPSHHLRRSAEILFRAGFKRPEIAVVLGSGLGGFVETVQDRRSVPFGSLPGFSAATVPGHSGIAHYGRVRQGNRTSPYLLVFQGRSHLYESGNVSSAQGVVWLSKLLGVSTIILTSAAGGFGRELTRGDLMIHRGIMAVPATVYSSAIRSGLSSARNLYEGGLIRSMIGAAADEGIAVKSGIYCWVTGPSFETPAEIRMLRRLGGDAVGMSTYPEVCAARTAGILPVGLSVISNLAAGLSHSRLSHNDVTSAVAIASKKFNRLLVKFAVGLS